MLTDGRSPPSPSNGVAAATAAKQHATNKDNSFMVATLEDRDQIERRLSER